MLKTPTFELPQPPGLIDLEAVPATEFGSLATRLGQQGSRRA